MTKAAIIKIHLIFWGLVLSVLTISFFSGLADNNFTDVFWGYFIRIFFRVFIFYSFYFTLPHNTNDVNKVFVFIIIGLIFLGITTLLFNYFFLNTLNYLTGKQFTSADYNSMYFELLISNFNYAVVGVLFRAAKDWYIRSRNEAELQRQNISNQLSLLRAQVDPHFLFNTLNNINSFIHEDPPTAALSMRKLRSILKYMLETDSDKVYLKQEMELIGNYIELQKIRFTNPDFIEFNTEGDYSEVTIPPLLFLPFVENAFKHGKKVNTASGITVSLNVHEGKIHFSTTNYISDASVITSEKGGFGIKNINHRLDLLFDNNYNLNISNDSEKFYVSLEIKY